MNFCYYEKNKKIEVDFELPPNWMYARLGDLITLKSGRDLEPTQYNSNNKGIPYITGASNLNNGSLFVNRWTENPMVIATKGELLITCKGTIGEMAYNTIGNIHIARQIMSISSNYIILPYIKIFLASYINVLQAQAKSMIPGISRENILQAIIPIPPIKEQYRIIGKYEQIKRILKDEI